MGVNMGLHPLLLKGGDKRNFRFMFTIDPFIGEQVSMLPPKKGARPNLSFKEYNVEHLNETIYFPGKVEWQTCELSLYDIKCKDSPIYEWLKRVYDPKPGVSFYGPSLSERSSKTRTPQFKTTATVTLYDGCGNSIEQWIYMNAYPAKIDWGELDMANSDLTTADLSLRYDRAYQMPLNTDPTPTIKASITDTIPIFSKLLIDSPASIGGFRF